MTMLPMKRDPMRQNTPFPRRGGLFGASPAMQPAMTAEAAPMAPKKGFDWKKALGVLGDSLSIAGGGAPQYVPGLMEQQRRKQAQEYAEQTYQRRRGDTLADQRSLLEYKRANPDPDYFDDNAGNRWAINPATGERKLIFRDPNAKRIPQKVTGPNGEEFIEYVEIPNNVNEDGTFRTAATSGPQPGAIEDGHRFKGGNPADPSSWEPVGGSGPPGIGSAPPAPTIMTRAQYQGFVQSMGKTAADAFLRRNGLTVGNN